MADPETKPTPHPVVVVRNELSKMEGEFRAALPAHIPVERFTRVILTAIQNNPDLLTVNRRSLWNSAMKAAQDGLLPDGRDGAIVPYKGEAQWLPMIGGIRKKVRNSGEIATWDVQAVYEGDEFAFELGDEPYIRHRPALTKRGKLIAVYSIATLKSGEKSRDVMSVEDVEKIRAKSRSQKGPWSDPTFYPEMAKKTVARRHSKVLPMSTDLDDLMRRDDALYDMEGSGDKAVKGDTPKGLAGRLAALAAPTQEPFNPETGEIIEGEKIPVEETAEEREPERSAPQDDDDTFPGDRPSGAASRFIAETEDAVDQEDAGGREQSPADVAYDRGWDARTKGMSRKAVPGEYRDENRKAEAAAWLRGFDEAGQQEGSK